MTLPAWFDGLYRLRKSNRLSGKLVCPRRAACAWLSKVGLFQDVSCVDVCDFEVYEQPVKLVESRRYILDLLGQGGTPLFPFGHDGAGDEIAVRGGRVDGDDDQLVFVDHETSHDAHRRFISPVAG